MSEWQKTTDQEPGVGQWILVITGNGYFAGQYRVVPDRSVINHEIGKSYRNFEYWISINHL